MKSQAQLIEQEIPFGDPAPTGMAVKQTTAAKPTTNLPAVPLTGTDALIAMALDKDLDVEKLERLLSMKTQEEEKTAKAQFNVAMAEVQSKIQPIIANADNDQTGSRYAKLDAIVKTLAPIYTASGFSVSCDTEECKSQRLIDAGWFRIVGELSHAGGFTKRYSVDLPVDDKGIKGSVNKTAIHGTKSAISYGRVILMGLMFNFTTSQDVDDDGNGAGYQPDLITDHEIVIINEAIEVGVVDKKGLLAFAKVNDFSQIERSNWATIHALIQRKYKIAEKANG